MKKGQIAVLVLACVAVFLVVYSPHFLYKYPLHMDEWNYMQKAIEINQNDYGMRAFKFAFTLFLAFLDRTTDLVMIYQYLPAIWAALTVLVLFYASYKKTNKNFLIALFAMIFYASLKSNVNIGGIWFFIPSVFTYLFIYAYVYFFTEGFERQDKKLILISLGIMLITLFSHPSGLLFAIPFLSVYALFFNWNYIKKEWKFFSLFLIIPIVGFLFFASIFLAKLSLSQIVVKLFETLGFDYGRMPVELYNSPFEAYSAMGYLLALFGIFSVFRYDYSNRKKYYAYILWPVWGLLSMIGYRLFDVSLFASYQRTFLFAAISLPFLSAIGLFYLLKLKNDYLRRTRFWKYDNIRKVLGILIIVIVLVFTFYSYYDLPSRIKLYKVIDDDTYHAMVFLASQPKGIVMARPVASIALYPITHMKPVGTVYFMGDIKKRLSEAFFLADNCKQRNVLLKERNVSYVLSPDKINCDWQVIYDEGDYVYNVSEIGLSKGIKKAAGNGTDIN